MKRARKKPEPARHQTDRRIVLYVDGDASYADSMRSVWSQLRLDEGLHIVVGREQALEFLSDADGKNGAPDVAAVILDPDATGDETGDFMREIRRRLSGRPAPVVFWTRDGAKYQVLEGKGVDAVLQKPMVLRLIAALDGACRLRVQPFAPFAGGMPATTECRQDNGVRI